MKDQLVNYVDLLFAGAPEADDIKQEILQNTLDRYDDLVSQGKTPQAAYSLAISGIGDISELLSSAPQPQAPEAPTPPIKATGNPHPWKKLLRAAAIFLYIISIIPLIVLSEFGLDILGLCGTIGIVAVATVLIILSSDGSKEPEEKKPEVLTPQQELRKSVQKAVSTVGTVIYFAVSFLTGAWHLTWLIFPITAAVNGIIRACIDLKEANKDEN